VVRRQGDDKSLTNPESPFFIGADFSLSDMVTPLPLKLSRSDIEIEKKMPNII
jgi:hypothetical protein